MSTTRTLYTLGYEGLSIDGFITRLKEAGIETVCDVRDMPLSHKRGFSKNGLAAALGHAGIGYEHWRSVGAPKELRHRYRADHDWNAYASGFRAHLATRRDAVRDLAREAAERKICLVCYEADAALCHRSMVAAAARKIVPLDIVHLRAHTEDDPSAIMMPPKRGRAAKRPSRA
jgi:uncharacterized protein (DUF488 family)